MPGPANPSTTHKPPSRQSSRAAQHSRTHQFDTPRHPRHWVVFFLCLIAGLLIAAALLHYSIALSQSIKQSYELTDSPARNCVGQLGGEGCYWLLTSIGASAWLIPLFLLWMSWTAIRNARFLGATRFVAMLLCIVSFSSLATLLAPLFNLTAPTNYFTKGPGGFLGQSLYNEFLAEFIGPVGAGLILIALLVIGLFLVFTKDIFEQFEKIAAAFAAWRERLAASRAARAELRRLEKEARAKQKAELKGQKTEPHNPFLPAKNSDPDADDETATATDAATLALNGDLPPLDDPDAPPAPLTPKIIRGTEPAKSASALSIVKPEETKKAKTPAAPLVEADYKFPPVTLLTEQPRADDTATDDEYAQNMAALIRIIGEFGITVSPGEIHVGPVITCYEVVPAPGVRVEKVANLDKNIALHMSAQSVRILAPIPGKAAIGIEIPNKAPTPVCMRDILESEAWERTSSKSEIPIVLGKDVSGKPLISDLTKMPHLLIAGATGSGKSVCINAIIASLVYRKKPRDLRLIMVDPKVVELKIFNTLPHMFIPVVTEPKKVPGALKWLLGEMEKRYQIFGKTGVRNIAGFNNRKKDPTHEFPTVGKPKPDDPNAATPDETQTTLDGVDPFDDLEIPEHLPYIVVIIDELADLMMVAQAEIENSIARLAQLARAAGIHIIIATQRPSVNVITGLIKANLPSRIAFQVASQVDSRTILDGKGAESLIGRGDMLFTPPGTSRLVRAQGAYVSDDEVKLIVEYLKKENGLPTYAQDVQDQIDTAELEDEDDADEVDYSDMTDDELYPIALGVVKATRRASTSSLQRKLGIGYNRAARMMDMMQEAGLVGPENGSKPREILVDLDTI